MRSSTISLPRAAGLAAVLLGAAILSGYFRDVSQVFSAGGKSYSERRVEVAFRGVEFDRLRAEVDGLLPRSTPVTIGPRRQRSSFWVQRSTEALYPRPVVPRAEHLLEPDRSPGVFGPDVRPRPAAPPVEDLGWSPWALLAGAFAALGYGLAARRWFLRDALDSPASVLGAAWLRGATILAIVASLATWTRVPIPTRWSLAVGLGLVLWVGVRGWSRGWTGTAIRLERPTIESAIPLLLVVGSLAYLVVFPAALWDGRSIWLFHGKQIALNGLIPAGDLVRPELQWSHPEYPLLFPSWLAHFTAGRSLYSERAALLGIAVMLAAVLAVVWQLSRDRLGRWYGALLPIVAFLGAAHGILGAYADGMTMFLLLGVVLGFLQRRTQGVGWLCAVAASLTKFEGLLFAVAIVAAFVALRKLRPVWPALFFLPAMFHAAWGRWIGLGSDFDGMRPLEALSAVGERMPVIVEQLWFVLRTGGYNQTHGLLWIGGASLIAALVRVLVGRRWRSDATLVLGLTLVLAALVLSMLLVSPQDLAWLTQTAMDRLLLHPAALGLLSLLLSARDAQVSSDTGDRNPG